MSERQDTLQQYVSGMLAVERHLLPAFENQSKDDRFAKHPQARQLVNKIEATIRSHINGLEQQLKNLGGDAASPVKSALTAALGVAASAIENVRARKSWGPTSSSGSPWIPKKYIASCVVSWGRHPSRSPGGTGCPTDLTM